MKPHILVEGGNLDDRYADAPPLRDTLTALDAIEVATQWEMMGWRRMGRGLERVPHEYRLQIETEGWGHPVMVLEVILTTRPTGALERHIDTVWWRADGGSHTHLRVLQRVNDRGDVVSLWDDDGSAIEHLTTKLGNVPSEAAT